MFRLHSMRKWSDSATEALGDDTVMSRSRVWPVRWVGTCTCCWSPNVWRTSAKFLESSWKLKSPVIRRVPGSITVFWTCREFIEEHSWWDGMFSRVRRSIHRYYVDDLLMKMDWPFRVLKWLLLITIRQIHIQWVFKHYTSASTASVW